MSTATVVDCDVHHNWARDADVLAFMPSRWRAEMERGLGSFRYRNPYPHTGGVNKRLDSFGPGGETPGTDPRMLAEQLLDPFGIRRAILSFEIGHEASSPNPHLAIEIARAANDWSIATWLESGDDRHYGAIMVPAHVPEEGAKEIRRVGGHPRMAEVLVVSSGVGLPLGHPVYHPVYDAANELGLPVALHVGSEWMPHVVAAGGLPNSRLEYLTIAPQSAIHHVTSFITHGVFERFPRVRFLVVEAGISWIPWLLWNLDAAYPDLRRESPWVKRLPSEYFREHVRVTTQPMELTDRREHLVDYLSMVDGIDEILCFASDYPHWDADEMGFIKSRIPREWRDKVLCDNACELFGWDRRDLQPAGEPASTTSAAS